MDDLAVSLQTFGQLLRAERKYHKVSMEDLYEATGYNITYINAVEEGMNLYPETLFMQRVCDYFELGDINELDCTLHYQYYSPHESHQLN